MKINGNNQESAQSMNRALVLRLIQRNNIISRAELAKLTGLKQATITNIINDFINWGLVEETGIIEGVKGRRAIGMRLTNDSFFVIGVRLARKHYDIGVFSLTGKCINDDYRTELKETEPEIVIPAIIDRIHELIARFKDKQILAIGVAVPGPYFAKEGIMDTISTFPGWKTVSIKEELQNAFTIPVKIDHDANAGVMAECSFRVDPGLYETILYLAVGQGIGAGIYNEGKILRGASGFAGEVGHTSINLDGPRCECGNRGCLTSYASTIAITERVNRVLKKKGKLRKPLNFQDISIAVQNDDKVVCMEFQDSMRYLSTGLANLIYCYNPGLIIIGDEISLTGERLLEELRARLADTLGGRVKGSVRIELSGFELDPAFVGAAEIAIDDCFSNTERFR